MTSKPVRPSLWLLLTTMLLAALLSTVNATAEPPRDPDFGLDAETSEIEAKLFQQITALQQKNDQTAPRTIDTSLWGSIISMDSTGLRLSHRPGDDDPWHLGLELVAHGRLGAMKATSAGTLQGSGARPEVDRGEIREWISRSGRRSLTQGLTLQRPTHVQRDGRAVAGSGELLFDFRLSGTFSAELDTAGRGAHFRDGDRRFRYGDLEARDAQGRSLPVRLELIEGSTVLRLRVDDARAAYPIVLLAELDEVKKLIQPLAGISEAAGWSADIDGDTAVVGAPFADIPFFAAAGKVYVFERDEGGIDNWGLVKELIPSDPQQTGNFGSAVTIEGDLIAVGANGFDELLSPNSGRAYIYSRNEGGLANWGEIKIIANPNPVGGEDFGWSIDLDGDTLAVGAVNADLPFIINPGKVYIFQEDEQGFGNWGLVQTLNAPEPEGFGQFGYDVAIDGDTLVVGADLDDVGLEADAGAAYVYERNQGGPDFWGLMTPLAANDGKFGDRFGTSVAIDGDTLVVGAWFDDEVGSDSGSAYVFERDLGGSNFWGQAAKLEASDRAPGDNFGISVAIQGDLVVVGAHNDDSPEINAGSAYRFGRDQGGVGSWGEIDRFTADVLTAGDNFGRQVAISGERVLVSAQLDDDAAPDAGASYIFELGDEANLSISVTDAPDPVTAGGTLVYTVTVSNAGPDAAEDVVVSHSLPGAVGGPMTVGCAEDGGWTGDCTLGIIASGGSAQYTVTVTVDGGATGALDLTASVAASTGDPAQDNNSATVNTLIGGGGGGTPADIVLILMDSADPVEPGATLTYTAMLLNNGPGVLADGQMSITLPAQTTLSSTNGCSQDPNGVPTCDLVFPGGIFLPGTSHMMTLDVDVDVGATGELALEATFSSTSEDPVPGSNTDVETTTIGAGTADIAVVIADSADPATAGDPLTYTIEVLNNGPDPAPNTTVQVNLPGVLGSPVTSGCAEDPNGAGSCSLGEIAPGSSKTFDVTVQIDPLAAGSLVVEAEASTGAADSVPANNTATETTTIEAVGEADLFVYQTDSSDPIDAGQALTYTVVVGNRGPVAAQNVNLATIVSDQVNNPVTVGCDNGAGGVPSCDLGSIAAGENKLVRITVQVSSAASGTLLNQVTATSANTDPDSSNNSATETTGIIAAPGMADLLLAVEDTPDPATPGEALEYRVTVINLGPHAADDVVVTSALPAALQNVQSSGCAGDPNGGASCSLGSIAANGVAEFTLTGDLDLNAAGILSLSSSVASSTEDPDMANNAQVETTELEAVPLANLSISLTDAQDPVAPGTSAVYTVTVENLGPDEATDVVVTGSVVGTIGTAVTTGCAETPGLPTCTLGTLASGATATFTLELPVPAGTTDTELITTVSVASAVADTDTGNNSATEETAIDGEPPVVENLTSIGDTGGGSLDECEEARVDIDRLLVTFDQAMSDPAGDSDPADVTNPASYQLMAAGPDGKLTTSQCGPDQDDDVRLTLDGVTYDDASHTATLHLGSALVDGPYRLMVCGDTLADASGTVLDGNENGTSGGDFERYFRVDTNNLFFDGHFDCVETLDGWQRASTVDGEIGFTAFDVDGALHSGGVAVTQLGSTEAFSIGRCVELPGVGNYGATADLWLRDLATGDTVTVTWECESFSEASCAGADLGLESSAGQSFDATTATWQALDPWTFAPPAGATSAICAMRLDLNAGADELTVLIDDLVLSDLIFADGFETGDTSRWSSTTN